ncbi:hypothetical protein H0A43_00245 [Arcobacter lanthieri]|uniref:hypothetical protein n=1 Tax=Aliarcobacter lanthieri TaxID=1355374 RepID=UPI0019247569|nr:hypothetical protein [Aliarcobacter lanthieri]MBL3518902.1 hypothetical protein [Aliarcobacter lanthieri]
MELINQPFTGQLGDRLIDLLNSSDFHTFNIIVAFAKNSGVLRIKNSLEKFRERGGVINAYVGVDLGGTSYEALTALLLHTDSLNIVHSEKGQTFHSKIYQFVGEEKGLIVVGSHNLTAGGLWTNFESSTLIHTGKSNSSEAEIQKRVEHYIMELTSLKDSFKPIKTQDDIDKLLENGYVVNEVSEQIRRAKFAKKNVTHENLFGNGVRAKLPRIDKPKEKTTTIASETPTRPTFTTVSNEENTIWFETRKMTGGSRNILDLSKKSLVEAGNPTGTLFDLGEKKFMRGAAEFFGLNPEDTSQNKDITLNFDGIDYAGNTILFPEGDHANGTWRLQIKGVSSSKVKITDALRAKGEEHFLVEKVVTFTKITDDYYFMSVFPEAELENFKTVSHILARNGSTKTAKLLGVL